MFRNNTISIPLPTETIETPSRGNKVESLKNSIQKILSRSYFFFRELIIRFPKNDDVLQEQIKVFTTKYSLEFHRYLSDAKKAKFEDPLDTEALRCLLIFFRTHHGNQKDYWDHLFFFLTHKKPSVAVDEEMSKKEDAFWDSVVSIGFKCLKESREEINTQVKKSIKQRVRISFANDNNSVDLLELNLENLAVDLSTKNTRGIGMNVLEIFADYNLYEGFSERWSLQQSLKGDT